MSTKASSIYDFKIFKLYAEKYDINLDVSGPNSSKGTVDKAKQSEITTKKKFLLNPSNIIVMSYFFQNSLQISFVKK